MPVSNNLFVTTKEKPDVATVGEAPSTISTVEVNKLSYEDQVALDRALYNKAAEDIADECGYTNNDAALEVAKVAVLRNQISKLESVAGIPVPSISCSTVAKFNNFFAKIGDAIIGPIDIAMKLYDDALESLKYVQDKVNALAKLCDGLDTSTSYTVVKADSDFLGIIDVATQLADPELWAKIAECGTKLANLPASILSAVSKGVAAKSIESILIIADSVEPNKISKIDEKLRDSAKLIGNKLENVTTWESLLAISGLSKQQLVSVLPFGFNPGGDILFTKDVYDTVRNGGGTVVYQDVIIPSRQQMASASVERRKSPKLHELPTQGGGLDPKIKSLLSTANGESNLTNGPKSNVNNTLVFGDTYTDQTGFIHILNDRISLDSKILIFRNNKQVRSRKLNPIPIPVPSYTP